MSGVTAGECFVKFFRLFRDFDYQSKAISIRDICFIPKADPTNVIVEFEGLFGKENVCRHVTAQGAELIFRCVRFTDRYLTQRPLKDSTSQTFLQWLELLKAEFDKAQNQMQPQIQNAPTNLPASMQAVMQPQTAMQPQMQATATAPQYIFRAPK